MLHEKNLKRWRALVRAALIRVRIEERYGQGIGELERSQIAKAKDKRGGAGGSGNLAGSLKVTSDSESEDGGQGGSSGCAAAAARAGGGGRVASAVAAGVAAAAAAAAIAASAPVDLTGGDADAKTDV